MPVIEDVLVLSITNISIIEYISLLFFGISLILNLQSMFMAVMFDEKRFFIIVTCLFIINFISCGRLFQKIDSFPHYQVSIGAEVNQFELYNSYNIERNIFKNKTVIWEK